MKKLFVALFVAAVTAVSAVAADGFAYGVWFGSPQETLTTDVEGVGLGLLVLNCRNMDGAALALIGNATERTSGLELAIGFNRAATLEGAQVAFVNIHHCEVGDFAFQLGLYNQSSFGGIQIGLLNNSRNNARFQLGILNINKNGMFPVMLLVNFAEDVF